jgi:hypothetical protein
MIMDGISIRQRAKKGSAQEKLDILADDFRKLEESRKDYIRELTRKLVDIHCGRK